MKDEYSNELTKQKKFEEGINERYGERKKRGKNSNSKNIIKTKYRYSYLLHGPKSIFPLEINLLFELIEIYLLLQLFKGVYFKLRY